MVSAFALFYKHINIPIRGPYGIRNGSGEYNMIFLLFKFSTKPEAILVFAGHNQLRF